MFKKFAEEILTFNANFCKLINMEIKPINLIERIESLENYIIELENKIQQCIKKIELLKAEKQQLILNNKSLEEENKRLQNFYKNYLHLQNKTYLARQKLSLLVKRLSEIVS